MRIRVSCVIGAILCAGLLIGEASAQETVEVLDSISVSSNTGEKPQSKVWQHADTWWAVAPSTSPSGTWVWRLESDESWTNVLQISSGTGTRADAKAVGDVTHILLHDGSPELVSVEYVPGSNTYQLWTTRPTATSIALSGSETATIDVDSAGRMWLATESGTNIHVYYSDSPYSSFSGPVTLASGVHTDDIAVVTALPNDTVGVLWSNQNTERFGFRAHADGTDPTIWQADEIPASQSAQNVGNGMADDHLNFAVASDATLYAAVKTSYDSGGYPKIALLVRRPTGGTGGTWDNLYEVDQAGTRGIVILNEGADLVRVLYTASEGLNDIVYRDSSTNAIAFGPQQTLMNGGLNDVTSTKQPWNNETVVLASNGSTTEGRLITRDPDLVGYWTMEEGSGTTLVDSSGQANDAAITGAPTWVPGIAGLGLHVDGITDHAIAPDDPSLDITGAITLAAWIKPELQATQDIIKKATIGTVDGYSLSLSSLASPTSSGTVFFRLNEFTNGNVYRVDTATMYPFDGNTWIHVAATYDGATMRIYFNGVEEASAAGPANIAANALDLGLGSQSDGTRLMQGGLDNLRVYSRALGSGEIAMLADVAPPPLATLVGHYEMDENGGSTLTDSSGAGLDGTISGDPQWTSGISNFALDLDGAGDYAVIPDDPAFDIDSTISISAWLRPGVVGTQRIVQKVSGSTGYSLFLSTSGFISFRLNNDNAQRVDSNYLYSDNLNTWVHVAAIYDGATMRLFIDGLQDKAVVTSGAIGTNSDDVGIGATSVGGNVLTGELDEVRIYDGALTLAEIAVLAIDLRCGNGTLDSGEQCDDGALNGNGSCCSSTCSLQQPGSVCRGAADTCDTAEMCEMAGNAPPSSGLVGRWDMEENGGTTLVDSSSQANDGTIFGAPSWTPGIDGLSLHQDGTSDYSLVPDDASLDVTTGLTMAAWIKPEKQDTQDIIKKATQGGTNGYSLSLSSPSSSAGAGIVFVRFNQATSGNTYRVNSATLYPFDGSTWVHVAATYDGTNTRIYFNGVEENVAAGPAAIATNSLALGIGSQSDGTRHFQGGLDQVLVYDRALSASEILDLTELSCPTDGFLPSSTECRASAGGCDLAETCSGASASCPADGKSTAECRTSAALCDAAEFCDGLGDDCPADGFLAGGTECRGAAGACDLAEVCTGSGPACPAADLKSNALCRGAAGACDVAEVCDGVLDDCPADGFVAAATECRASAGVCDVAEACSGSNAACPADGFEAPTTTCRPAVGVCDATELCTGSDPSCPADDVLDGVPCVDGDLCNGDEMCVSGVCTPASALDCDDGDPCTADSCDSVSGCFNDPIPECGAPVPVANGLGQMLLVLAILGLGATGLVGRRHMIG